MKGFTLESLIVKSEKCNFIGNSLAKRPVLELDEIIKACQEGDRSAQKALYERFAPRMLGVCRRYARNNTEAEDFLQDGFIKAFQKVKQFRFQGSFEGWLRRLMVNLIIETLRKKRPLIELHPEFESDAGWEEENDEENQTKYSLAVLLELISQLPERYRMVFNLFVFEEEAHEQIAYRLGISEGTSKSNLFRARKWLQKRLSEISEKEKTKLL